MTKPDSFDPCSYVSVSASRTPSKPDRVRFRGRAAGRRFDRWRGWLLLLLAAAPVFIGYRAEAQGQNEPQELKPETPAVTRELSSGQSHAYKLLLPAGRYLRIVLEPREIDCTAALSDPDGAQALDANPPGVRIGETNQFVFSAITKKSGSYILEIKANQTDASGRYTLKIEELRAASEQDSLQLDAQRLWAEGWQAMLKASDESRRLAVQKYELALGLCRQAKDPLGEARTLTTLAALWYEMGNAQKVSEFEQMALPIWKTLGLQREEGITESDLGLIDYVKYQHQKALEHYERALPNHRAAKDLFYEAETLNRIGWNYSSQGEKQQALQYFLQALPLRRQSGSREGESVTLNDIGRVYMELGDIRLALDAFDQALKLRTPERDPKGAANILNRAGIAYRVIGELQKSLDAYTQALSLARTANDKRVQASLLSNLGLAYVEFGNDARAMEYFESSLKLAREMGIRNGEATILQNMGISYHNLGDEEKYLDYLKQSLEIQRAIKNGVGEADSLRELGAAYNSRGEYKEALVFGNQALEKYRTLGVKRGELIALSHLGISHAMLGDWEKSFEYHDQSLRISRSIRAREDESIALLWIGYLRAKMGNMAEARDRIEEGLSISESARSRISRFDLRTSYMASRQKQYILLIDVLMTMEQQAPGQGNAAAALQTNERALARGLLEMLAETNADLRQGGDVKLLAREKELHQQISAKSTAYSNLLSGKHSDEQTVAMKKELSDLTDQLSEVNAKIRQSSPKYAGLTQPQPLQTSAIQGLLDDRTVLLEYALGEKRSWMWVVTPSSVVSFELPAKDKIEASARRVREALTSRGPGLQTTDAAQYQALISKSDAQYPAEATELSRLILGPIASQLQGEWKDKRLVIVASGALDYLPFSALPVPPAENKAPIDFQLLIADHEILSLPSASALAAIRSESAGRPSAGKMLAILADPVFEANDPRVELALQNKARAAHRMVALAPPAKSSPEKPDPLPDIARATKSFHRDGFSRLPFSREEAEAISAYAPQRSVLKVADFRANLALATSGELSQYRILHFATHGLLNSETPELSGLVLSLVDEEGKPRDGFLRMHEIYSIRLAADVVVLSACQTALGKEIKGEGLVGLTRGFMYAGAQRVVASLWQVDDLATAELMKRFYRGMLKDELRPAAALRQAQLEMMKQKRWAAPYFWSGFVLQGEWR